MLKTQTYEQIITTPRESFVTCSISRDRDVLTVFHYESNQRISGLRIERGICCCVRR